MDRIWSGTDGRDDVAMWPSTAQIETAAYSRWLRRGGAHGFDREDWLAAEDDLLFSLNYRVVARERIPEAAPARLGAGANGAAPGGHRRCRFCERTESAVRFGGALATLEGWGCLDALVAAHECDECRLQFRESLEPELARFARPFRDVPGTRGLLAAHYALDGPAPADDLLTDGWRSLRRDGGAGRAVLTLHSGPYLPIAALKALTRLALGLMAEADVSEYEGALEWVGNPDHDLDRGAFGRLACRAYLVRAGFSAPWASLARRVADDAPLPATVLFLGAGHCALQVAVPLGTRDEDLDGEEVRLPRLSMPGSTDGPPAESPTLDIPLAAGGLRRGAALELSYAGWSPDVAG
jgi:hypothetical protein